MRAHLAPQYASEHFSACRWLVKFFTTPPDQLAFTPIFADELAKQMASSAGVRMHRGARHHALRI